MSSTLPSRLLSPRATAVLSFTDRCQIEDLTRAGYLPARIADLLRRPRSTITRELAKGRVGGQGRYRAVIAQDKVDANRCRAGRPAVLVTGGRLFAEVVTRFAKQHSPEQITARLRRDFPDQQEMWVSHETIYQALRAPGQ